MQRANWRLFDFWLLGAVALLTIFGIMMINSSIAGNIEFTEDTPLVQRQLIFAFIGFAVVFLVAYID
jgi:rod shape determining protein RodA